LAARLQAEEDRRLARELDDERLARAADPWVQAEAEWGEAMKAHEATTGAKAARELQQREEHADRLRKQREEEDRKLAEQIAREGTPVKGKQTTSK